MSQQVSISNEQVVQCTLDGITLANSVYERWSGGYWLSDGGIEGFLSAKIAERIFDRIEANAREGFVSLETPFAEVADAAGGKRLTDRQKEALAGPKRVDVAVWDTWETISSVIEVKRSWTNGGAYNDLERLAELLAAHGPAKGGTLKLGCLAVFLHRSSSDRAATIPARIDQIRADVADWFNDSMPRVLSRRVSIDVHSGPVATLNDPDPRLSDWQGYQAGSVCIALTPVELTS